MPRPQNKLSIRWFTKKADELKIVEGDSFLGAYPHLLRSFRKLNPIDKVEDFALAAHAVYGWMPTMLDLAITENVDHSTALRVLTARNEGQEAEIEALDQLMSCLGTVPKNRNGKMTRRGRSIVGVSKLLHFLLPDRWPIWDKRVGKLWPLGSNFPAGYWSYSNELRKIAEESDGICALVNEKLKKEGYRDDVNTLRALEMLMFYNG